MSHLDIPLNQIKGDLSSRRTHQHKHLHLQLCRQRLAQAPPILLGPEESMTDDQALIRLEVGFRAFIGDVVECQGHRFEVLSGECPES